MLSPSDLKQLSDLLRVPEEESSDEDLPVTGYARMGPGDVGKKSKMKMRLTGEEESAVAEEEEDPKSIWTASEVPTVASSVDAVWDPREKPTYSVRYSQGLTSQDLFLQMSNKTPCTASCERMIISVPLPGESKEAIDCQLERGSVDIRSRLYRLHLPLPQPVHPASSSAEWDPTSATLVLTLQLDREYDFINF